MKKLTAILIGLGMFVLCNAAHSQAGRVQVGKRAQVGSQDPTAAVRGNISYQRFKTDGSQIQMIHVSYDRSKPPVESTYVVKIPIVTKAGTEYRSETRTRRSYPVVQKILPVPDIYTFLDLKGKEISREELIGKLGMGEGRLLVSLMPGQKIPETYKQLLNEKTIFFQIDPAKRNVKPKPAAK